MATWEDVRRRATALPGVAEKPSYGGTTSWKVAGKGFVWERPLRPRDLADLGWTEQPGPVLGASVPDPGAKEALLAEGGAYFTTPHFWSTRAPVTLARTVPWPGEIS